jgi:putative ABC transport system permease protein
MNMPALALAYARRRPLSTMLVVLLLSLGIAIVTLTLLLTNELTTRLTRDAQGIDLVVGAKGSPLQLVLSGVYHVDVPPGNIPEATVATLRANPLIAEAIPLALGDSYRGAWIVGSEPALIEHYDAHLREGRMFEKPLDAVLGSAVAARNGLKIGDRFVGSHGVGGGGEEHAESAYTVTGVLAPTDTVLDRMIVTGVASVWAVHEHHHDEEKSAGGAGSAGDGRNDEHHDDHDEHSEGSREVTMVLVRYASPLAASTLPRAINRESALLAASPATETARLLTIFGVGTDVLRGFAWLMVAASTLMLFVALSQSLEERRYDLAILRVLGASRAKVAAVLLIESAVLACVSAVIGIALGHLLLALLARALPAAAPLAAGALHFLPEEWAVAALALGAGILAALWPAWRASHVDVAHALADH